jgi:hypothetical protein
MILTKSDDRLVSSMVRPFRRDASGYHKHVLAASALNDGNQQLSVMASLQQLTELSTHLEDYFAGDLKKLIDIMRSCGI